MKTTFPLLFVLAACGPELQSAISAQPQGTQSIQQAQGGGGTTTGGGGGGRFQFAVNSLFYNPRPAAGEGQWQGYVYVAASFVLPADLTVTFNGVPLVRGPLGWVVVPAGAQPAPDAAGNLVVVASSVSAKISRSLTLPCAPDVAVTADPVEGSSLSGVAAVALSYDAALTAGDTTIPISQYASGTLYGYDAASDTLGNVVSFVYAIGLTSTSLTVAPTSSPGYAAQLTYPGLYILDGNTGGSCGRVKRLFFAQ
jgi:hypothetical protein